MRVAPLCRGFLSGAAGHRSTRRPRINHSYSHTYQEQLYAARRIDLAGFGGRGTLSTTTALSRLSEIMKSESILSTVRSRREFVPPTTVRNMARMQGRQRRFNAHVHATIAEINEIYRRLK